jgi:hypothetical protein
MDTVEPRMAIGSWAPPWRDYVQQTRGQGMKHIPILAVNPAPQVFECQSVPRNESSGFLDQIMGKLVRKIDAREQATLDDRGNFPCSQ